MSKFFFRELENQQAGYRHDLEAFIEQLCFNDAGLIAAIAQQHDSKEVLMMAWMNQQSLRQTLETGKAVYWSRTRQQLWVKGEQSGHVQEIVQIHADCDGDCLLLSVNQQGVACHTHRPSCFFWSLDRQKKQVFINYGLPTAAQSNTQ